MTQIDAVLPLVASDVSRALILIRSLERYFAGLGTVFVVTPDAQASEIGSRLRAVAAGLDLDVVPESRIVPEFELEQFRLTKGWYKQQLVKLAIAEHVATPFYLTLDADVVATRPVSPEALAPGGRALCFVIDGDRHPDWYQNSERLLDGKCRRKGISHNVTPAVLAREGVLELAKDMGARFEARRWVRGLGGIKQRFAAFRSRRTDRFAGWRLHLAAGLPWTEYALYYTFLEINDRFDAYHQETGDCVYDVERSIWRSSRLDADSWDPTPLFEGPGPPFFAVVQSNSGFTPESIAAKLARFL